MGLKPDHSHAWRLMGDHLMATGDDQAADDAYMRHIRSSTGDPRLRQAAWLNGFSRRI
ncbi:MAG: hypothetical protein WD078_07730 [Woeseia sp.]